MASTRPQSSSDIMSEKGSIVFGQVCESMKNIHNFLKTLGLDLKWKDDEFDEATALALLVAQNQLHAYDFIQGGGFNSESKRYKKGNTVVIRTGAKYYSSSDAEDSAGIIAFPTSGVLKYNAENDYGNYYDEKGELQFGVQALNVLKVVLLPSPIEDSVSTMAAILGKSKNKNVSASGSLLGTATKDASKYSKKYGGYNAYSTVYLRKEDVCPSFSDIMISENLLKIIKTGEYVSQGIELINDVTVIGTKAAQFQSNDTKELNDYLNKTDKERAISEEEKKEKEEKRKEAQKRKESCSAYRSSTGANCANYSKYGNYQNGRCYTPRSNGTDTHMSATFSSFDVNDFFEAAVRRSLSDVDG